MLKKIGAPLLLAFFLGQGLYLASHTGQTLDETFYNGSGYAMVRYNNYHFLGMHPPLIMQLGSLPLLALQPNFPIDHPVLIEGGNGIDISQTGSSFLYKMGNDANLLLFLERLPNVLITLVLGVFLFLWSSQLSGAAGGILSLFLFSFCPNLLAHASLFTTDAGMTAFFFVSCYFMFRYFAEGKAGSLVWCGIFAGLACVSKVSAVALFPAFGLLFALRGIQLKFSKNAGPVQSPGPALICFAVIMVLFALGQKTTKVALLPIALFALAPQGLMVRRGPVFLLMLPLFALWFFAFFAAFKLTAGQGGRIAAFGWVLTFWNLFFWMSLNKLDEKTAGIIKAFCLVAFSAAVVIALDYTDYAEGLFKLNPFKQYLQSFLIVLDHSKSHHGVCVPGSFISCDWKYFPALFLVKTPLLLMALALSGAFCLLFSKKSFLEKAAVVLPPLLFFVVATFLSTVRIGIRHVLPVYPFLYLMAGATAPWLLNRRPHFKRVGRALLLLGCAAFAARNLSQFPHYISFYNETIPNYERAAELMADSNLNWGQDNRRLAEYVLKSKVPRINVLSSMLNADEFNYYKIPWKAISYGDLKAAQPGYYALDRTLLNDLRQQAPWIDGIRPVAKAGQNYVIYKVEAGTPAGAEGVRPGL